MDATKYTPAINENYVFALFFDMDLSQFYADFRDETEQIRIYGMTYFHKMDVFEYLSAVSGLAAKEIIHKFQRILTIK